MNASDLSTFVLLKESPLAWVTATIAVYCLALAIHRRFGFHSLTHPVGVSVVLLALLLIGTGTGYDSYYNHVSAVNLLLGPVTVALASPLYQQLASLRRNWHVVMSGALLGAATSTATAMIASWLMGASRTTMLSLAVKSVTMPIAVSLTQNLEGSAALTSALVMLTGMVGVAITQPILKALRLRRDQAVGFTLGIAAHGIGASRAFQVSSEAGAYAGLAMALAGMMTGMLLPIVLKAAGW
jgi:putative effector of murein hydrolase